MVGGPDRSNALKANRRSLNLFGFIFGPSKKV